MIGASSFPDGSFSRKLSLDISNRLVASLYHIIDFYRELITEPVYAQIINNLEHLNSASNLFWIYSAINRRLVDFIQSESNNKVVTYLNVLASINQTNISNNEMIDLCSLNRFKRTLFNYFATEGVPGNNTFYKPDYQTLKNTQSLIKEVHDILKNDMNEFYQETINYINTYIIFSSNIISSGSSSNLLKCIYIQTFSEKNKITLIRMLDRIIHETAHMHIHLLSIYDPILLNNIEEKYSSPFRQDARPLIGIFHAHFVLFRLITILQSQSIRLTFKKSINEIDEMLFSYNESFSDTQRILKKHARFTPLGQRLFEESIVY